MNGGDAGAFTIFATSSPWLPGRSRSSRTMRSRHRGETDPALAGLGEGHLVSPSIEEQPEHLEIVGIVLDDEDARHHAYRPRGVGHRRSAPPR
jgi:hypothetical protein